jgi:nicotinamide riboside transporter PnuC
VKNVFDLIVVPFVTIVISIILGIIFKDNFLGVITLIFSFFNAYYLAKGKWYNYIFGLLASLSYGYICAINGLFGWGIFELIFYIPSQIYGIIN